MAEHGKTTAHDEAVRENVKNGEQGYTLGIAGFITSFFVGLVGFILSIIALRQAKAIGRKNPFALAGVIIGGIQIVFGILAIILGTIGTLALINYCNANQANCQERSSSDRYNTSDRYQAPEGSGGTTRTY